MTQISDPSINQLLNKMHRKLESADLSDTPETSDSVSLSSDEVSQYYKFLNVLEHQCQQRLFGVDGLQWSMARCGDRVATPDQSQLRARDKMFCSYLPTHQNIKIEKTSIFGCTGWGGWILPFRALATLEEDKTVDGRIIIQLPLTGSVSASRMPDDKDAKVSIYFDANGNNPGTQSALDDTRDAWADLISAKWDAGNKELFPVTGIPSKGGDTVGESLWEHFAHHSFPYKSRLLNIPIQPLLNNASADAESLQCYIDTGSAKRAKRICTLLNNCLMLNMIGVVNQYRFQKDDYVSGDPLIGRRGVLPTVRNQALESSDCGVQILSTVQKGNGNSLYERRWAETNDPDLLFDVIPKPDSSAGLTDNAQNNWHLVLCGNHLEKCRLKVTGLIGTDWSDHTIVKGDIAEFTDNSEGLLLELSGHTLPVSFGLKDRLMTHMSRCSAAPIISRDDLAREALKILPPALVKAVTKAVGKADITPNDLEVRTRFGQHPLYPTYAVPVTSLLLPVTDLTDALLMQQGEWLCRSLNNKGLPAGTYLQVELISSCAHSEPNGLDG